jgi:hypothetical protein
MSRQTVASSLFVVALLLLGSSAARAADPDIPFTCLKTWLAAGFFDTDGGVRVATWKNSLGTGVFNANTTSIAARPRFVNGAINGLPVVRFDGAQQLFTGPMALNRWTIFVVGKNNSPSENFGLILGPGDNSNNQLRYENGTQVLTYGLSNGMPAITTTVGNTRVYNALTFRYNGSVYDVFRDGILKATRPMTTSGNWILGRVGSWYSSCPSCYLNGDLAEILVYDCALTDAERVKVDVYLRSKFALP